MSDQWPVPDWARPDRWWPGRSSTLIALLGALGLATVAKIVLLAHDAGRAPETAAVVVVAADDPGDGAGAPAAPSSLLEPAAGPTEEPPGVAPAGEGVEVSGAAAARRLDAHHLSAAEIDVLHQLAERRAALEQRERGLDRHAALLETAEAKLVGQIDRLTRLRAEITAMIEAHDAKEEAKIANLVKIYETMRPKAAAEIFNRLEMSVLLQVIERMREPKSADVLARMDPAKAKLVTAALARRSRLLGEQAGS